MRRPTLALLALAVLTWTCAAPGVTVSPQTDDFAFLEIQLQG